MIPEHVLLVHNRYRRRGGEDEVVEAEAQLLRDRGHRVTLYERDNRDLDSAGWNAAADVVWSRGAARELAALIDTRCPDIVHLHNTFPRISPAVCWIAARQGVPVVQTLHNFRLACVQAMFLRDGRVCEDCLGRGPWRGVVHGCYRGSRAQSAAAAAMLSVHRRLGTWRHRVQRYIALNRFCRDKFLQAGLPASRVVVKPNFVDLPCPGGGERRGVLFVGRLSPEKGTRLLLQAVEAVPQAEVSVIGDGPDAPLFQGHSRIDWRGPRGRERVYAAMRGAAVLVMPSIWYENFPRTLVEAYACGLPVVAARLGAMEELVEHEGTGLLFEPGSPAALAEALRRALGDPGALRVMGGHARAAYERRYTPERNYRTLMHIYTEAQYELGRRSREHGFTPGPQGRPDTRDAH